jgi:hypothetical protein
LNDDLSDIAFWAGGDMLDITTLKKDSSGNYWMKKNDNGVWEIDDTLRPAAAVDRMDGTGYRANGKLQWDKSGNVTIDGDFFTLDNTDVKFSSRGLIIGDALLVWDADNSAIVAKNLKSDAITNIFATGDIVAQTISDYTTSGSIGGASSIGELVDVELTNVSNKQLLMYSSEKNHWVNVNQSEIVPTINLTTSGSGNAFTAASLSSGTLTLTKDTSFSVDGHTHTKSQITDFPTTWAWDSITGKPSTYSPSSHTHAITDIASLTGLKTATTTTDTGWSNNSTDDHILPTMSFMAYWNGAYESSTSHKSNLTYCNQGAFGTIVTKSTSDYLSSSTTYAGSSTKGGAATSAEKVSNSLSIAGKSFNGSTAVSITFSSSGAASVSTSDGTVTISSTDTKNTAGASSNDSTKLYLVGAKAQETAPPTYTNSKTYIDSSNVLNVAQLLSAGEVTASSDMRLKNVIGNVDIDYNKISKAPIFKFSWKDSDDKNIHIGTSAQYWKEVFPELVVGEDKLSLNYATLGTVLGVINSRREDKLEKELKKLKKENSEMKKELQELKKIVYELCKQ